MRRPRFAARYLGDLYAMFGSWEVTFGPMVTLPDPYDPSDPLAAVVAGELRVAASRARALIPSRVAEELLGSKAYFVRAGVFKNVDAVLFWMVHDAQKAALEVQDNTSKPSSARQLSHNA